MTAVDGPAPATARSSDETPEGAREARREYGQDQQGLRQDQQVFNRFFGPVLLTGGSTLGVANAGDEPVAKAASRRMTGPVPAVEIASALGRYAVPALHTRAMAGLRAHHVVVLYGEGGTGRRTAAINMLHAAAPRSLVALSPAETLDKLAADQVYREGNGYLLCGLSAGDLQAEAADFVLGRLALRVQEAGAWLVITSQAALGDPRSAAVPHFRWERPGTVAVLTTHGVAAELAESAAERLGETTPLSDVVRLAEHLVAGSGLEDALGRTGMGAAEQIESWLDDERRTDEEVLEAAALLFLEGMPEQRFEAHLARLTAGVPAPEQEGAGDQGTPLPARRLLDGRRPRRDARSIIKVEERITDMDLDVPGPPRRCLVFRSPAVHERVGAELSLQFGERFWEPIFTWLHETVQIADVETRMQIARGLAILASYGHFDTVRERFLQPWSEGAYGARAWVTAPKVVWWMSAHDPIAAMAVRTAIRWARSNNPARRQAACLAFAGEMGVRYPADATKWLWHLVTTEPEPGEAQVALAQLYALLVEIAPADARAILADLGRRLAHRQTADRRERILKTLLLVMAVFGVSGDHPAAARHLLARAEDLPDMAALWAVALCHRPVRSAAFGVLYDLLCAVGTAGRTPEEHLRMIGDALHEALPEHEREPFRAGFERYVIRRRAGGDTGRLLLSILLNVFRPPAPVALPERR
ncbi:hypothetical protein ACFQVD_23090 [Streptosporangium amethystogenes subsp. fukuiense]|uniref:Uncharacterized protein n=1 Tax=Streptosporangium amethystogenes subsp. fukuiense TaxID=698418 RepID=A0ABW2T2W7_9ACTN